MPSYSTPGVYIEEVPVFPPSIAPVATAIPAFIGASETATGSKGESLIGIPTRIASLVEYEALFGGGFAETVSVTLEKYVTADGSLRDVRVGWDKMPEVPTWLLYPSLKLYFANGGGPCYVYSIGRYGDIDPTKPAFKDAFSAAILRLETEDEPTLIVFPDAVKLADADYGDTVDAALASCEKMKDRFTIADVPNAMAGGTVTGSDVTTKFRGNIKNGDVRFAKYGAAYFPYLQTSVAFGVADSNVKIKSYDTYTQQDDGKDKKEAVADAATKTLDKADLKTKDTAVYNRLRQFLDGARMILPPSGAVAGIYAQVDRGRGVWKAPANVGVALAVAPAVAVTNDLQDGLNIDPTTGKSVNVIRSFLGKGTMLWGARTLAGNDNEWKYVNVRRFASFVEESVSKAIATFVFEPNNKNTWVKVRTMIRNFLENQWRDGALMGGKADDAFRIAIGLGETMSPQDVLDGIMKVEVYLAIVRPAEFIVLRFMQKMPES